MEWPAAYKIYLKGSQLTLSVYTEFPLRSWSSTLKYEWKALDHQM